MAPGLPTALQLLQLTYCRVPDSVQGQVWVARALSFAERVALPSECCGESSSARLSQASLPRRAKAATASAPEAEVIAALLLEDHHPVPVEGAVADGVLAMVLATSVFVRPRVLRKRRVND